MPIPTAVFFQRLGEGAALAALVTVPLYFTVFTDRVFEPDKAGLLRSLALVALAAGLVAWRARRADDRGRSDGSGGRRRPGELARTLSRHPILLAAGAVWIAECLSTLVSVAPWTSVMGSFSRGQGLYTSTMLGVMLIMGAVIAARPGGTARLAAFVGVTVFPAGLYGVIQSYNLDPLPWGGDVTSRVVGPAGASVFFGAHLVMALPFAAWPAASAWARSRRDPSPRAVLGLAAWLVTLALGLWALLLSGSRGPILGLGAGLAILGLAALARAGRWRAALGLAGLGTALVAAIIGLNVIAMQGGALGLPQLSGLPLLGRLSRALDPENSTTRVRLRLWDGTTLALAAAGPRLAVGHGPESMDLIYAPFYPPILAYDEPRGWVPDRAHNLALDSLVTTGALGLIARLAFFTALVDACLAAFGLLGARRQWLAFWLGGGAAGLLAGRALAPALRPHLTGTALPEWTGAQAWLLAGPGLGLGLVAGLALWLVFAARRRVDQGELSAQPDAERPERLGHGDSPAQLGEGPRIGPQPPERLPFAAAALVAVVAHWTELQVGFSITSTQLVLAVVAGGLVGLGWPSRGAVDRPRLMPRDLGGAFAAVLAGFTLIFDFGRFGTVAGGHAAVVALIALSVVITGLAVAAADAVDDAEADDAQAMGPDDGPVANETDGPAAHDGPDDRASILAPSVTAPTGTAEARHAATPWLVAGLALGIYTVGHVILLSAGTVGPADGVRGATWTLAWYGLAILGAIAAWARGAAGGWPGRRDALAGGLAVGLACLLAVATNGGATIADALAKEGRLGWQAQVSALRREGESGKAESFLDRAEARYALAARLAPWEPAYRLALARSAVEHADLLDARLSRALAESGRAETDGEYRSDLPARVAALVRDRDDRIGAALADLAAAERLGGPAPGPALTRARALRVWGERIRAPERRSEVLAEARTAYDEALARAPRWPEVLDEAAAAAILAGVPAAALDLTGRAIALDAYFVRAWRTAASAHAELGDPAAAAEAYARYFEDYRNASDLPARRAQLEVLVAAGRSADAMPIARDITRLAPGDPHAHADLAALLEESGELGAALAEARRAAELDPDDPAIAALVRMIEGRETPRD